MKKDSNLIIKKNDTYFIVEKFHLENMSYSEALSLSTSTLNELRKVLVDEALTQQIIFVGRQKLVTGLNNTLTYLNKNYPEIFIKDKQSN